jgi:hypothetical protein
MACASIGLRIDWPAHRLACASIGLRIDHYAFCHDIVIVKLL